ncbi:MAG: SRPBCC family protein [Actinomycetota bacterium]|nr:SRPBCC family protein [Actinomycetota bacterium]
MSDYLVSESRAIPAAQQRLFDIVADPAMHPRLDGSGSVRAVLDGNPQRLAMGAKFGMDMKVGARYKITNTVVEFDEPNVIAWRHFNGHVWRYLFMPVEGATLVTEQWDARPAKNRFLLRLAGFPRRNRNGILASFQRLEELATSA